MGMTTKQILQGVKDWTKEKIQEVVNGENIPALAENLAPWADQKAIATPDTYTDAVRTTGGDIPIETSAGSKLESIKPVAGSKWTAKLLFNGSYNMLNAAKWGATNSQPYVGGVGGDFVYFLVPELTLGTFGTADENNGLLFTDADNENVQPASVYYKPLGATVPQSLTDGTSITPTSVSYDGNTYKDYATSGAGWLIIPKSYYDNDVCAHIAWEDWYDKHVSLNEPTTNPEAVVGILMLEGLLALAHSDKYLRGVNEEVCDNVVFGETSATISHMVDEVSVAANAWTNAATGESDSQGNTLYRHSTTISGIKQGGAACVEGEDGGIPLTVNGTTVSYIDTNATAPASVVFYQIPTTAVVEKAYSDSVFSGSNIDQETGVLPINDCSIEAQVAMDGNANITVKYAKNIVDQVAINATVDVPQIKEQVEKHEERIINLEDTAVRTGSYDASVAVGLSDNFKGDTIVEAEFYKRKTGGTQSVGSGIAAIKEIRGKSIVWNQLIKPTINDGASKTVSGLTVTRQGNFFILSGQSTGWNTNTVFEKIYFIAGHKYALYASHWEGAGPDGWSVRNSQNSKNYYSNQILTAFSDFTFGFGAADGYSPTNFKPVAVNFFDLTLRFGAGNEPATVEEFEAMFPLDYYDYNAGEVIPFAGQNLVTIGFNQWDEKWEEGGIDDSGNNTAVTDRIRNSNIIKCFGNTYYYIKASERVDIVFYDKNGSFLSKKKTAQNVLSLSPLHAYFIKIVIFNTTYNHDICINISNPDRNGTYEPYEKHTLPLNPSQWRDKQGNLVFPYGGMHGVGNAYDYAKVDADGYIRKATPVFGGITVGDYNYTKQGNLYTTDGFVPPKANMIFGRGKSIVWNQLVKNGNFANGKDNWQVESNVTFTVSDGIAHITKSTSANNGILQSVRYLANHKVFISMQAYCETSTSVKITLTSSLEARKTLNAGEWETVSGIVSNNVNKEQLYICEEGTTGHEVLVKNAIYIDLTLMFGAGNEPATIEEFEAMFPLDYYAYDAGSLGILVNQTYANAAAFKAAMDGVPLIYELATPVEVELATPIYAKYLVDKDGTEEITPANGAAPYTTPANLSILYAMDARGEIKNLPKNYLSKESAENMLNAMVSAGVIASYTMTWDSTNNRYAFVIQKNSEQ